MTETISEDEFEETVDEHAERLYNWAVEDVERDTAYTPVGEAIRDLVGDVLNGHEWFARAHYGAAAYGCIIEYAADDGVATNGFGYPTDSVDTVNPEGLLRRLAYYMFRGAVVEDALGRVDD